MEKRHQHRREEDRERATRLKRAAGLALVGFLILTLGITFAIWRVEANVQEVERERVERAESLREAAVAACDRGNLIRRVLRVHFRHQRDNLLALDPNFFNIPRPQYDRLIEARVRTFEQAIEDLEAVPCEREFPDP